MTKGTLRIALAQVNATVGDLAGNARIVVRSVETARASGADMVVFPELVLCGYPPEDLLLKKHFIADIRQVLEETASRITDSVSLIGFVEESNGLLYNAAALVDGGRVRGVYRKRCLPNYGVFDEERYFAAGTEPLLGTLRGVPFGVTICEDIWTDGIVEENARRGARVIINLSASPYHRGKMRQRREVLSGCARRTGAFVCYVNLVGGQDELVFDGGSVVVDPAGQVLRQAPQFSPELLCADIGVVAGPEASPDHDGYLALVGGQRGPRSTLSSAGPRVLDEDEEVYRALVLGTGDYVRKNGFRRVVIGLSGGIDSALTAVIARDALGADAVVGVSMPSRYSSAATRADARTLALNLGIEFREVPIQPVVDAYAVMMAPYFSARAADSTEENIQARVRGNILMAFSNKFGWLVLTTGNKSELAVGYCTLYGDMAGGFAVIKDVPKTLVYVLARLVNDRCPGLIPQTIISREPSAELREHQKDTDSLPPYPLLDEILQKYVEQDMKYDTIIRASNADPELVKRVIRMVDRNEYKRRQSPAGVKITPKAFGRDRRLPITNAYAPMTKG